MADGRLDYLNSMSADLTPEQRDLLSLHLVPGLGPRLTAALLDRFGSAAAVLEASARQLTEVPHIGDKLAEDLRQAMLRLDVSKELGLIEKHDARLLPLGSSQYPSPLATVSDAPHLLYMLGAWEERDANAVALVGSRHGTAYGRRIAERLAADLSQAGFTVVSGLARGVDGAAHRGALRVGGRTVAVLAGGLSRIYPPEHAELALEVKAHGALFSEAPMAMEPLATMFPQRNRLISGLSRGVVVVEAAERSGALITARHAAEQGRAVFAVPGAVDSPASAGTLKLIRDGATLVRRAEDIIEELDGIAPIVPLPASPAPTVQLDEPERRIWDLVAEQPLHIDDIAREVGLSAPQAAGTLMAMEMKKAIRRLPGNRYERR
jgi:DNA processing protein